MVIRVALGLSLLATSLVQMTPENIANNAQFTGPTPYRSFADSPFAQLNLSDFQLETFEDHLFNTPGVKANVGIVTSTQFFNDITDSVDGDDGNPTNGICLGCDSFFSFSGPQGIIFTFDANAPGGLPTHAGVVWTDGEGLTTFEAFDRAGASLGVIGPVAIADGTPLESTAEDRFFGVIDPDGISAIKISNTPGGIEIDHLQFGRLVTCFDQDHDGYGSPGDASCPAGAAEDCDDQDARISPAEHEVYDGRDNNCDGQVDEHLDDDGDGIPNFYDACNGTPPGVGVSPDGCPACALDPDADGDGFPASVDCNDGNSSIHPSAAEVCDLVDNDCDGFIDEGFDMDHDGFTTCAQPLADCNDFNAAIRPGAQELPGNTVDENCDGSLGACDPRAPWQSHGEFVRCVATECSQLVATGVVSDAQCDALVSQAGGSGVGK